MKTNTLEKSIALIRSFAAMEHPPTDRALQDAEQFAKYLFGLGDVRSPDIHLSPNYLDEPPDIVFEWNEDGVDIHTCIDGDDTYSCIGNAFGDDYSLIEYPQIGQPLPSDVIDFLAGGQAIAKSCCYHSTGESRAAKTARRYN